MVLTPKATWLIDEFIDLFIETGLQTFSGEACLHYIHQKGQEADNSGVYGWLLDMTQKGKLRAAVVLKCDEDKEIVLKEYPLAPHNGRLGASIDDMNQNARCPKCQKDILISPQHLYLLFSISPEYREWFLKKRAQ